MDVLILARLSRKAEGRSQTSIESQDIDARDWAREQEHNVVATVADHISGMTAMWNRPNAKPWVTQPDLMAKYQGIVAAKHDRLSRADWRDEAELRMWAEDHEKALFIVERNMRWPPRSDANHDDDVSRWNNGAAAAHREWSSTSRRYKRMHRNLIENNLLTGRAPYGYRIAIAEGTDHKTLVVYEPEACVVREMVRRYLGGETIKVISEDFNARRILAPVYGGKPGKVWYTTTIAKMLRNSAIAGRRMDNCGKDEKDRRTILRYEGIITWAEHEQLVARLDSRAHRKGISPSNVYTLTGLLTDESGRKLRGMVARGGRRKHPYFYYYGHGLMIRADQAEAAVSNYVIENYGNLPHMVPRVIPGKNNFDEIARLRQDRAELDDLADDYDERHAAITAEIRRLTKLDKEHPEPDDMDWVESGKTIMECWQSLDSAGRRDWLRENGCKITVVRQSREFGGWSLRIVWTAEGGRDQQAESLGFPISQYQKVLTELT